MPRVAVAAVASGLAIVCGAPIPMLEAPADVLRSSQASPDIWREPRHPTPGADQRRFLGESTGPGASSASRTTMASVGWLLSDFVGNAVYPNPAAGENGQRSLAENPVSPSVIANAGWLLSDFVGNALHVNPTAGDAREPSLEEHPCPSAPSAIGSASWLLNEFVGNAVLADPAKGDRRLQEERNYSGYEHDPHYNILVSRDHPAAGDPLMTEAGYLGGPVVAAPEKSGGESAGLPDYVVLDGITNAKYQAAGVETAFDYVTGGRVGQATTEPTINAINRFQELDADTRTDYTNLDRGGRMPLPFGIEQVVDAAMPSIDTAPTRGMAQQVLAGARLPDVSIRTPDIATAAGYFHLGAADDEGSVRA